MKLPCYATNLHKLVKLSQERDTILGHLRLISTDIKFLKCDVDGGMSFRLDNTAPLFDSTLQIMRCSLQESLKQNTAALEALGVQVENKDVKA